MKIHCLPLAAALGMCGLPLAVLAQASAPPMLDPPSATRPSTKPGPRLLTPAESRQSASPAGDLRPERPVTPQVSIPLGKRPAPANPSDRAAPSAGSDPAAARCESLRGEQVRAKCRDDLARARRARPPG